MSNENIKNVINVSVIVTSLITAGLTALVISFGIQSRHSTEIANIKTDIAILKSDNKEHIRLLSSMETNITYIKEILTKK